MDSSFMTMFLFRWRSLSADDTEALKKLKFYFASLMNGVSFIMNIIYTYITY